MKKLKLDIEMLQVDTFDTLPDRGSGEGSVRGNELSELCQPVTQFSGCCSGQATCNNMTCNSCQDTTNVGHCFCTECVTCWNCADA
jgi:hypothetical protein